MYPTDIENIIWQYLEIQELLKILDNNYKKLYELQFRNNIKYQLVNPEDLGVKIKEKKECEIYVIYLTDENKDKYKELTLLSAAKTPDDFCFKYDIEAWEKSKDIDVVSTIDTVCTGWDKKVGLCPNVLETLKPSPVNTVAIVCGPPIMIKYTLEVLDRLEFKEDMIYTTLERRMKCGIGKCGRCNIGEKFVCLDGPVFSLKELNALSEPFM